MEQSTSNLASTRQQVLVSLGALWSSRAMREYKWVLMTLRMARRHHRRGVMGTAEGDAPWALPREVTQDAEGETLWTLAGGGSTKGARSSITGCWARPSELAGERAALKESSMLGELGAAMVDTRHGAAQV
ncbi:unnamed protein product [Ilex paraguariensis]|uniref:Uncharacterized protein n=1 Tax=Ilex paraguariensis TaxID=185542 RepID=A0ABC8TP11_9AQUA